MSAARGAPDAGPLDHTLHVVGELTDDLLHAAESLFQLPERASSPWHRAGLGTRGERVFNVAAGIVMTLLASGWTYTIATTDTDAGPEASAASVAVASALTDPDAPSTAFLADAALAAFTPPRGTSGKLRAELRVPGQALDVDSVPAGAQVALAPAGTAAPDTSAVVAPDTARSGVWSLALRIGDAVRPVADFNVINMLPFSAKRRGRIGGYLIGSWPTERRPSSNEHYNPPPGFIEVTPENQNTQLSDHFRLRDFLTHDQQDVWPKYLVIDTKLIDKLELVLTDLQDHGVRTSGVHVMSGFRSPQYNAGGGDPTGRAALSRHMYGDAADIFIDNDGNGNMDDLNHDGRVNIRDAEVIEAAVERVERAYPALVGGCGAYVGNGAHGPFTHIDTRGYRARWLGTGDG